MRPRSLLLVLVAAAAVAGGYLAFERAQRLPTEPVPVAWDREPCAHCHMLVGDPRYAAQLVTVDGQVLNFDDPGCLMRFLAERRVEPHAIWFRDRDADRWMPLARAAFVRDDRTPMGYGLAAVDRSTPGALSWAEASR